MSHATRPLESGRVLVVDDDISIRHLMRATLDKAGFEVRDAENGSKALKLTAHYRPDIVLLDVQMPFLDGFAVCRHLRGQPETQDIPILIITALEDIESVNRAYDAGATDFITKPVNWPTLTHRVRYMLRASRAMWKLARTVHELDDSRAKLAEAQRLTHLGNWDFNSDTQAMTWSDELYRILGYLPRSVEASLQHLLVRVDSADRERLKTWFDDAVEQGQIGDITYDIVTGSGKRRTVHQRAQILSQGDGIVRELHAAVQDVTEQRLATEEIRRLAYVDTVTGLPNRAAFEERLSQALALAGRHGRKLAVLCLDLDNFKRINDSLGHTIGDLLLKKIGGRLVSALRRSDTVSRNQPYDHDQSLARLGGDEFIVLLSEIRLSEDAAIVASRILETLSEPVEVSGHEISVTASIGVSFYPRDGGDVGSLLKSADVAMYGAKRRFKNHYQFFAPEMNARAVWRLKLEEYLRKGVARQEFALYYQPIVDLETETVQGVEALLRWRQKELGAVPPDDFLPVAEETGLIVEIGKWVLRTACMQIKAWREEGLAVGRVSVNISVAQFLQSGFPDQVARALAETGLAAEALELEITESLLMQHTDRMINTLVVLKELGVGLVIDDFGQGYSSMAHLRALPIDRVKISPDFVSQIGSSSKDAAIVRAIIALAEILDLGVVAEGVETEDHFRFLKAQGCAEAQGFHLGRPLPPPEVINKLKLPAQPANKTPKILQA